ncbi:MAG: hypothetical protein SWH78_12770 [Thermodesulfobacteriota bacterium]|nr:hypothetical protein [Thermodesulfobacteriota bacterium]
MTHTDKVLAQLAQKVRVLPKVDEKGRSECPFAEDLYAAKEEAAEKVREVLDKMPGYLRAVDREILRCKRNLAQVRSDAASLHLDKAQGKYHSAQENYRFQHKKYMQVRQRLIDLRSQAQKALQKACANKWPAGKPQKKFHGSAPARIAPASHAKGSLGPSLATEVNSLLSLDHFSRKDV